MICCDLQTQLDGISMIVMALLFLAAVRVLRKGECHPQSYSNDGNTIVTLGTQCWGRSEHGD